MMKTTIILALVSATIGLTSMGQNSNDKEKTKISIIHCEGNEIQVHDTIIDALGGYTAEQFILAKGFEAGQVEIIHTKGDHGLVTHSIKPEIWFINGNVITENYQGFSDSPGPEKTLKKIVIEGVPDENGHSGKQIVLIDSSRDLIIGDSAFSNRTFQIRSPEVDLDLDRLLQKARIGNEDPGTSQKIEVKKTINDDGDEETRIWIDGKEVSHEMRGQGEGIPEFPVHSGSVKMFKPSEMMISPDFFTETDFNSTGSPYTTLFNGPAAMGQRLPFTIALVTPLTSKTDVHDEPSGVINPNNQIDNLSFFPNPTEGNFRLSFNVTEEGRTSVRIFTIEGKEVYKQELGRFSGAYEKEIDISHLGPGTYILHILKDKNRIAEKLIVQ